MAQVRQPIHHLRCHKCNGYGFVPIQHFLERRQEAEKNCPACGGTGTKRDRQRLVQARQLAKQKGIPKMTLSELEQEIRRYAFDGEVKIRLGFNESEDGEYGYEGCEWLSDADREKAFNEDTAWTIQIYGTKESHLDNRLHLGASSLPMLVQSLARYDLEPVATPPTRCL